MSILFSEQKSPDLKKLAKRGAMVLLPIGQTEQHGGHLPVGTDSIIAREVALAAGKRINRHVPALVMETITYGYSVSALTRWSGTIVVQPETLIEVVCDICFSLIEMGFNRLAILSVHGNHPGILRVAARRVGDMTGVHPAVVFPLLLGQEKFLKLCKAGPEGSCHGGEYETSLMLHLAPHLVDMRKAGKPNPVRRSRFDGKVFWSTWGRQTSTSGIYGDPSAATAETGKRAFEAVVSETVAFLLTFAKVQY